MSKYRLVKYEFHYEFALDPPSLFITFPIARPSIYLGLSLDVAKEYYLDGAKYNLSVSELLGYPLKSLYSNEIQRPNSHLIDLIQSDNIDCTEIEITGEWTFTREGFFDVVAGGVDALFRVYFLEKI